MGEFEVGEFEMGEECVPFVPVIDESLANFRLCATRMLATLPSRMAGTSRATTKGAAKAKDASSDASSTAVAPMKDTRTLRERYDDVRARVAAAAERSGRR
ncbi:MAG: hypothetical protein RL591_2509, partial [Planctomycetota bacterium]